GTENEENTTGGSNSLSSVGTTPERTTSSKGGETPFIQEHVSTNSTDTTELHHAPEGLVETNVGDYTKLGMASALETLCGQAFGAGQVEMLGIYMQLLGWGTAGAAAAYDISAWGIALAQMVYVVGWCKEGWKGLSWLAFKDLWGFMKLSFASAIMLCLEVWYFMTLIVLTGHLDNPVIAIGSLSICMNVNGWEGILFIGVNAAVSVRVSNALGSGHPRAAKYSVVVTVVESLIIGVVSACIILVTKDHFAIIFTDSIEMQKAVSTLAPLLGITMILNSVQPVLSGVAVGGGWQGLVAYINLFCYYIMGLPLGFYLGYKGGYRVQVTPMYLHDHSII
ncbi:protein TRANPARENT TESTA 12-like, partial [Trifolium pratense]